MSFRTKKLINIPLKDMVCHFVPSGKAFLSDYRYAGILFFVSARKMSIRERVRKV